MSHKPESESGAPDLWPTELPTAARQLVLDLGHTPSHAETDFVVADGNEMAYRHVMSFPAWSSPLTLLVGPAKSGKSHLASIWVLRSGARTAHPDDLEALAGSADPRPVLVEDADAGRYPESGLFHLLNQSIRSGRPVLMTARSEPRDWPLKTEDALSRVRLATSLFMAPPDDTLLSQMFVKLFSDRQIAVEPGLVSYLVRRMERVPNEVVALVDVMDRLALSRSTAVTRAIAAEAIALRAAAYPPEAEPVTETGEHHG
jgi:chromosomal replication initiation ATPase DnaA